MNEVLIPLPSLHVNVYHLLPVVTLWGIDAAAGHINDFRLFSLGLITPFTLPP